ncbi:MAG: hypothetical protein K0R09_6 [Clostridiales bacterium]|jgi:hypothetical protein|nr:hypothetical protein [Clostridiales bacterium]
MESNFGNKPIEKPNFPSRSCECKGEVKESQTLCECENYPNPYPGYAKIPIVLGEFTVQIDVESKIKLDEPAIEIKRIRKNVFLTQCRLIPGTNKLFLEGYVRKNIEYATKDGSKKDVICGDIKHTTVKVPFKCVTKVCFNNYPKLFSSPVPNEVEYFDKKAMGKDMKEQDIISTEFFNEKVFCELEKAHIYEADIVEDYDKIECHPNEFLFSYFIEKEVIYLTIKLLQKQQAYHFPNDKSCEPELSSDERKNMVKVKYE